MNDALSTLNLNKEYIMTERLMNPLNDKYEMPWAKTTHVKYRGDKMSEKIITYPPKVICRDGTRISVIPMELHWYDKNENEVNAYYIDDVDTLKSNFFAHITRIQSSYDEYQRIVKKCIRKGFLIYNKLLPHKYDIQYVKNHNIHYKYDVKCTGEHGYTFWNCEIVEEDLGLTFNHGHYMHEMDIDKDENTSEKFRRYSSGYEYHVFTHPNNMGGMTEEYKDNKGNAISRVYDPSGQIGYKKYTRDDILVSNYIYTYDRDGLSMVSVQINEKDNLRYRFFDDEDHDIKKIKIYRSEVDDSRPIGEKTFMFKHKTPSSIFNLQEIIPNDIKKIIGAAESYRFGHLTNSPYEH